MTLSKIQSLVILLALSLFSYSQAKINNTDYFENIVIFKIKEDYLKNINVQSELRNVFKDDNKFDVYQKFPDSEVPLHKFNQHGEKLVNLSLIYELKFQNKTDIFEVIKNLSKKSFIEYVEPLYHNYLLYVPDDPMNQTDQYWLTNIKAFEAWDIHKGDTNTVIGIVDTGIDISHIDLIYNIKYNYNDMLNGVDDDGDGYIDNFRGWDFGDNNNNPQAEVSFHGSWVSGIAAATTDNGVGMSGVGFYSKFLPVKVMNSDGIINSAYDGVVYAADQGCKIINCSWGSNSYQRMAQDVINYATYNRDALVIGACGNTNSELVFYPASYENVLSVAATTVNDEKWTPENTGTSSGSSYGPLVDISAPGTMMRTTGNGGYFLTYGGTSFAAPVISGAAAILRSYFPEYSALQIGELLKISADNIDTIPANIPYKGMLGYGRLNMLRALTMEQTPSIVMKNIQISEKRSVGDTIYINGEFINYLASSSNLHVKITSESPYIEVLNDDIVIGSLQTLDSYNSIDEIALLVLDNAPLDLKTFIKLEYIDDSYTGFQNILLNVNLSYKNIFSDNIELSVVPGGRFGYTDLAAQIGQGMLYKGVSKLFYDAGIIAGTGADRVLCAVRQISDLETIEFPQNIYEPEFADREIFTSFSDQNDPNPLGLEVKQTFFGWSSSYFENLLLVRFQIINKSESEIDNFHFGIFTDWDLINSSDNSAHYHPSKGFMYCKHNGLQTMFSGIKLLSAQQSNHYALAQIPGGDGIIDLADGFSDIEKFHVISNSNFGAASTDEGQDVVIISSAGPLKILINDTIELVFAFVAAESLYNILQSIDRANILYQDYIANVDLHNNEGMESFNIFPIPADNLLMIEVDKDIVGDECKILLTSIRGDIVIIQHTRVLKNEIISVDVSSLPPGIYSVKIVGENKVFTRKVIIAR